MKTLPLIGRFLLYTSIAAGSVLADEFVEHFGTRPVPDSPWTIEINATKGFSFSYAGAFVSTTATTRVLPKAGAFDYVQDALRAWAFDGESALFLYHVTPERSTLYQNPQLPSLPPDAVLNRLPQAFRLQLNR